MVEKMPQTPFILTVLNVPDIECGAGLAVVLQTPDGQAWLYDTGTGYPRPGGWLGDYNSGRDAIAPFLAERGLQTLDGVVISHAHYDHFGGLLWLCDQVPITRLVDTGYDFTGPRDDHYNTELADYDRLREGFRARPEAYQAVTAGDTLDLGPGLTVDVIAPPAAFFHEPQPENRPERNPAAHYLLNTNSLMLRIRHGELVFLLPGDIEKDDQRRFLLPSVPPGSLKCDVLVAPGHGLHTAPDFARATRPRLTLASIFARWANACTAREGFAAVGSKVLVTGLHGDLQVVSDGQSFEVTCSGA